MRLVPPSPPDLAAAWARRGADPKWPASGVTRFRDLLLLRVGDLIMVIACDSNAGIGDQLTDVIRQPLRMTGYAAAKVPLMEVLAAGARPVVLVNNLSCALDGPGQEMLAGIEDCLRLAAAYPVITGSDETNIATTQSGIGITVIGLAEPDGLLLGGATPGDVIAVVGRPMDGLVIPYQETDPDIATPRDVMVLAASSLVHEVLPVGSKGVGYEANQLARTSGLAFVSCPNGIDVTRSAGSSTCVLVACPPHHADRLAELTSLPIAIIGHLRT